MEVMFGVLPRSRRLHAGVRWNRAAGSTGFGERTDPEISRQVLARYHALLQETIDAHGGTVAKFMGDGMMATFGIPEIAEDDARRAVRAGVDMQRRFEAFAADVIARYGEARLEKACRPGHVLVGDETWRITRGDLAYEALSTSRFVPVSRGRDRGARRRRHLRDRGEPRGARRAVRRRRRAVFRPPSGT
jgi:class 3 adenylate cyclase